MNDELFELVVELQLFTVEISDDVVEEEDDDANVLRLNRKLESVVILLHRDWSAHFLVCLFQFFFYLLDV
jgi:hypothetical protein